MQLVNIITPVAICLLANLITAQGKDGAAQDKKDNIEAAFEFDFGGKRNDDRFNDFGNRNNGNDGRFDNRGDFEDSLRDYIDDRNDYDDDD